MEKTSITSGKRGRKTTILLLFLALAHIHRFTRRQSFFSHTVLHKHRYTLTQGPMGSGVCTRTPRPPPPLPPPPPTSPPLLSSSLALSPSLSFDSFSDMPAQAHLAAHPPPPPTTTTTTLPALPQPPSLPPSLYISPVRHLHGNVERDLCPWRAV